MSVNCADIDNKDLSHMSHPGYLRAFGDSRDDGKVQVSFTLPVRNDERGHEAAKVYAGKMGLENPHVAYMKALDETHTFYVLYGRCVHSVDYAAIQVHAVTDHTMSREETELFIKTRIGRPLVVLGASTGSDAHTVGIDAIMNRKGFAGHYGLERYEWIEGFNMGAQVPNETFIQKAIEIDADVLLVSQTVTQKDAHVQNLTALIELLEAEGLRERFITCCGGARITNELAKELGYDAGFGAGKFAEDVATFIAEEMIRRMER